MRGNLRSTRGICRGLVVAALLLFRMVSSAGAAEAGLFEVAYPPSQVPGELVFGVTYTVWIPPGDEPLRGVIVHQHGCGRGACQGGGTAAYDLHWRALARKWNCALLGPSYQQADGENCRLWCDPRQGSNQAFLKGLDDLAKLSGRPELARVPWCLWGHSGGGFWASLMQTLHPERIVAIWCRSGTAIEAWERGEIPAPEIPAAAAGIPLMVNPGVKERDDQRFRSAWTGAERMFRFYRSKNAPVGMALDPKSGHECGDSRYLAIPWFDACLAWRLPAEQTETQTLRPVPVAEGWLAPWLAGEGVPANRFEGEPLESTWLPSAEVARAWSQYVREAAVSDATPPPAPSEVRVRDTTGGVEVTWQADADLESGLAGFVILRDGNEVGRLPEKPIGRFGKPLFQVMSYHDTPEKPLPAMKFVDRSPVAGKRGRYTVRAINAAGELSTEARAAE